MSSNSSQNLETAVLGSGIKTHLYKPRSDTKAKSKELVERKPELTGGEEKSRRSLCDKRPWTSAEGGATAVILGRGLLCAAVAEVLYWLSVGVGGGSSSSSLRHCVSLIDLMGSRHRSVFTGTRLRLTCPEKKKLVTGED